MHTTTNTASNISSQAAYKPGVCNINSAEVAYRRKAANVLLGISLMLTAALLALPLDQWLRVGLFAPYFLTAVCYLQVKYKFCVSYGAQGKQNAAEGDKEAQNIVDAAARRLDSERTRKIKLQAAGVAAVATVVVTLLPF